MIVIDKGRVKNMTDEEAAALKIEMNTRFVKRLALMLGTAIAFHTAARFFGKKR